MVFFHADLEFPGILVARFDQIRTNMESTYRVYEASVNGSRVRHIGHSELVNIPEALKIRAIDYPALQRS